MNVCVLLSRQAVQQQWYGILAQVTAGRQLAGSAGSMACAAGRGSVICFNCGAAVRQAGRQ